MAIKLSTTREDLKAGINTALNSLRVFESCPLHANIRTVISVSKQAINWLEQLVEREVINDDLKVLSHIPSSVNFTDDFRIISKMLDVAYCPAKLLKQGNKQDSHKLWDLAINSTKVVTKLTRDLLLECSRVGYILNKEVKSGKASKSDKAASKTTKLIEGITELLDLHKAASDLRSQVIEISIRDLIRMYPQDGVLPIIKPTKTIKTGGLDIPTLKLCLDPSQRPSKLLKPSSFAGCISSMLIPNLFGTGGIFRGVIYDGNTLYVIDGGCRLLSFREFYAGKVAIKEDTGIECLDKAIERDSKGKVTRGIFFSDLGEEIGNLFLDTKVTFIVTNLSTMPLGDALQVASKQFLLANHIGTPVRECATPGSLPVADELVKSIISELDKLKIACNPLQALHLIGLSQCKPYIGTGTLSDHFERLVSSSKWSLKLASLLDPNNIEDKFLVPEHILARIEGLVDSLEGVPLHQFCKVVGKNTDKYDYNPLIGYFLGILPLVTPNLKNLEGLREIIEDPIYGMQFSAEDISPLTNLPLGDAIASFKKATNMDMKKEWTSFIHEKFYTTSQSNTESYHIMRYFVLWLMLSKV